MIDGTETYMAVAQYTDIVASLQSGRLQSSDNVPDEPSGLRSRD